MTKPFMLWREIFIFLRLYFTDLQITIFIAQVINFNSTIRSKGTYIMSFIALQIGLGQYISMEANSEFLEYL